MSLGQRLGIHKRTTNRIYTVREWQSAACMVKSRFPHHVATCWGLQWDVEQTLRFWALQDALQHTYLQQYMVHIPQKFLFTFKHLNWPFGHLDQMQDIGCLQKRHPPWVSCATRSLGANWAGLMPTSVAWRRREKPVGPAPTRVSSAGWGWAISPGGMGRTTCVTSGKLLPLFCRTDGSSKSELAGTVPSF